MPADGVGIGRLPRGLEGPTLGRPEADKKHRQAGIADHIQAGRRSTAAQVAKVDVRGDVLLPDPLQGLGVRLVSMLADERSAHALGAV